MNQPFVDFQEVKTKVSIPDVLGKLDLLDQFTEKSGRWSGACPLPQHSHAGPRPNASQFKFDDRRGEWLWHCFGDCNAGGDVIELVSRLKDCDKRQAGLWIHDWFSDRFEKKRGKRPSRGASKDDATAGEKRMPDGKTPMRFYLDLDDVATEAYLKARGISPETAGRYGVGMCHKGMFKGYLCVPCYRHPRESDGEYPVGYCGRWPMDDYEAQGKPRYLNGFETGNVVFGLGLAVECRQPLIVVEGWLKALWMVDRGFPNAVSTFTATVTDEQARILIATERPIVLAFDGNESGYNGMRKAVAVLSQQTYVRRVILTEGKEPDELSESELTEWYGFAKP